MLTVMGSNGPSGYSIDRSLRFRSSASAYLNRTNGASPTNNKIFTYSGWAKRGILTNGGQQLISAGGSVSDQIFFQNSTDVLKIYMGADVLVTSQVFRDPSAWYHIILAVDTTQATDSNRVKLYINGTQVTAFSSTSYPSQNYVPKFNASSAAATIARYQDSASEYFDGYLAEVNFIDGQALTPSSFGQTDTLTGVWVPKKYTGTYGTNGFYLNFSDNTSATTLAYDKSGNGNNWTPNNISTTAGATYDSMTDVPTLTSETAANYCVLNPLNGAFGNLTLSAGNLSLASGGNSAYHNCDATIIPEGNKGYFEITCTNSPNFQIGVGDAAPNAYNYVGGNVYYIESGGSVRGPTYATTIVSVCTPSFNSNDVVTVAFDFTNPSDKKMWFGRNGTWGDNAGGSAGNPSAGTNATLTNSQLSSSVKYRWYFALNNGAAFAANFGQRPFSYTPPTGFKALNTYNLPDPTIKKPNQYMDAYLNTGSGTTRTDVIAFQPDLVWTKTRNTSTNGFNIVQDSVRGAGNRLITDGSYAEYYDATYGSFTSTGFQFGSNLNVNTNGNTYVDWFWKESATAGFDIVTYTGDGTNRNISHNLGVAPSMIIVKSRNTTDGWYVCHVGSWGGDGNGLFLNNSAGIYNRVADLGGTGITAMTSSYFTATTGSGTFLNTSSTTYVAYLWSAIYGMSAFGTYTGNGDSDGPMVYLGFRPRYILAKPTNASNGWFVWDTARDTYNVATKTLSPNSSDAEQSAWYNNIDVLSNGFKVRSYGYMNGGGVTYIYAAFAENPFKYANAR